MEEWTDWLERSVGKEWKRIADKKISGEERMSERRELILAPGSDDHRPDQP